MKPLSILFFVCIVSNVLAQAPAGFKYQAVIRDAAGQVKANTGTAIGLSILQGSTAGSPVYTETHHTTSTETGLINLTVGEGSNGGSKLSDIDWQAGPYYLHVTVDGTFFGTSQLLSVPYALYALKAGTIESAAADSDSLWNLHGNTGTTAQNFLGTKDNRPLVVRTNNIPRLRISTRGQLEPLNTGYSVFLGEQAGQNDTGTNNQNVFVGYQSGTLNETGKLNTAIGYMSMYRNKSGGTNTAVGIRTLTSNTTGSYNTALGADALSSNTAGTNNTAVGNNALYYNLAGGGNIAVGVAALYHNTTGSFNTAVGNDALRANSTGAYNTGVGHQALQVVTTGVGNTALGAGALTANSGASYNTASGYRALRANRTGQGNTAMGALALTANEGAGNTAVGYKALAANTTAGDNTAVGKEALAMNTFGKQNTAVGSGALAATTEGGENTAIGTRTLALLRLGNGNTAVGSLALSKTTDGDGNTAVGNNAMLSNQRGRYNTALGEGALYANINGQSNIAIGLGALRSNTYGVDNIALGGLERNTFGERNIAIGTAALNSNTIGAGNIGIGPYALHSIQTEGGNTAVGHEALIWNRGSGNTALGAGAFNERGLGPLTNSTAIGSAAQVTASHEMRFGNESVGKIGGQVNWSAVADSRVQSNPQENVPGLAFISRLRPITFQTFHGVTTGFAGQEVLEAANAIGYDFSGIDEPSIERLGDMYSLRYAEFVVPLVKAIQEQQAIIDDLTRRLEMLEGGSQRKKTQ